MWARNTSEVREVELGLGWWVWRLRSGGWIERERREGEALPSHRTLGLGKYCAWGSGGCKYCCEKYVEAEWWRWAENVTGSGSAVGWRTGSFPSPGARDCSVGTLMRLQRVKGQLWKGSMGRERGTNRLTENRKKALARSRGGCLIS